MMFVVYINEVMWRRFMDDECMLMMWRRFMDDVCSVY